MFEKIKKIFKKKSKKPLAVKESNIFATRAIDPVVVFIGGSLVFIKCF